MLYDQPTRDNNNLKQSNKVMKGRIDDCKVISTKSLDLRDKEVERNLKSDESKIEEVKLFDKSDP